MGKIGRWRLLVAALGLTISNVWAQTDTQDVLLNQSFQVQEEDNTAFLQAEQAKQAFTYP